ncbi:MAG: anthranilate phosphoribosyltransferase [Nitrososphaerota archaeon]|nr:anthranilate phosphoribosyltransferase [Nitrososphaerales archaeon]MCX8191832.1 anthranilate phosphoribosyltransferase [Nitrososphaerales archaeon]MDW8044175.1 anthranilate phosphoribosyltransferase [Nitrososphaerota archaeon]
MIRESIGKLVNGCNLSYDEACNVMKEIMSGKATSAQIASFLTALRMKGETIEEIIAFATVMRDFCCRIHPKVRGRLVDTCGTGGDKIKTFNVSTTAAFVVAGAGISVAKHGNRSVTSKSGSADVLRCLGLNLNVEPKIVEKAIENINIGFIFAPIFHPAIKYTIDARVEIGIRTVFNILGPLTNPAFVDAQLLGVYDINLVEKIAHVLKGLGLKEAMVVHGLDGLDEISTVGKTLIAWLKNGEVKTFEVEPEDLGVKKTTIENILETGPEGSVETTFKILYGCVKAGDPKRDLVVVNAAAGIIVGGMADDFSYGVELANRSIESGAAYKKLKELIKFYDGSNPEKLEELESKYG